MRRSCLSPFRVLRTITVVAAVVAPTLSCAPSPAPLAATSARTGRRALTVVSIAPTSAPKLEPVTAAVQASISTYVDRRVTLVRTIVPLPQEEREQAASACATNDDAPCLNAAHADVLIAVTLARSAADQCSVAVRLSTPSERREAPAQTSACRLPDLEAAVERGLRHFDDLRALRGTPPPPRALCENTCTPGEKGCKGRATAVCDDADWDGCVDWTATPCDSGTACVRGACVKEPDGAMFVAEGPFRMGSTPEQLAMAMEQCRARAYACVESWWRTEQPAHWVQVSGFWIDRTEVTNTAFTECVHAGKCAAPDYRACRGVDAKTQRWVTGVEASGELVTPNKPLVCVTHDDARAFCSWRGRRLPTEAEWEKAARGTDERLYPWGNEAVDGARANSCDVRCGKVVGKGDRSEAYDDNNAVLADVGSYPAGVSPAGALDMTGNVWEWVADWYGEEYYRISERRDPRGPDEVEEKSRAIRGGSWSNEPDSLRAAYRYSMNPRVRLTTLGFRCAYP